MSSYAEIARRRRQAHALYLKLWVLGLDVYVERCAAEVVGRRVVVEGLKSLNPAHADRLMRLVQDNEAGLLEILSERVYPEETHR
jgi:hypothetical protein